jgi:hypothetical protein
MTELEFIDSIDCAFPYESAEKWRPLVEKGTAISANAAFMILHELCRLPRGVSVPKESIYAILDYWVESFQHPICVSILPIAKSVIDGEQVSVDKAIRTMREIAPYQGQYNALAIPYFACDDTDGFAEALRKKITTKWEKHCVSDKPLE